MLIFQTKPSKNLTGEVCIPGDKSISHRALILSAIANGRSQLNGFLMGEDNLAAMRAMQQMGVNVTCIEDEEIIIVDGVGLRGLQAPPDTLDFGNSGTALRLMAGLLSGQPFNSILTGDESLCRRPMARIVEPLRAMGAHISMTEQGTAPLSVTGTASLKGMTYSLPVASAQVKTCLLLAGLYAEGETCVVESVPTRDHAERLFKVFQYPIAIDRHRICLTGGGKLTARHINIPGDISSAAFFIVAAVITPGSSIILRNVGVNPTRIGIVNLLKKMGASIDVRYTSNEIDEPMADIYVKYSALRGIDIPADQVPLAIDEFPVIFIAAACANGTTTLHGARELRVKETDRIAAMVEGLQRLGVQASALPDGVVIQGGMLRGGTVDSYADHRIAMAFAVAGCLAADSITITNCDNVATSFPNFAELASSIGMCVSESAL